MTMEPAFPGAVNHDAPPGMTLRDWFAGQALAGYFANPNTPHRNADDCGEYMYRTADDMLAARARAALAEAQS
jgi:hypothetical protein